MEQKFKEFLISEGYSEYTPSGNPSTVYDYIKRINRIIVWETLTWDSLKDNISHVITVYDIGGEKEYIGRKSHNSYISALRAFKRFVGQEFHQ